MWRQVGIPQEFKNVETKILAVRKRRKINEDYARKLLVIFGTIAH